MIFYSIFKRLSLYADVTHYLVMRQIRYFSVTLYMITRCFQPFNGLRAHTAPKFLLGCATTTILTIKSDIYFNIRSNDKRTLSLIKLKQRLCLSYSQYLSQPVACCACHVRQQINNFIFNFILLTFTNHKNAVWPLAKCFATLGVQKCQNRTIVLDERSNFSWRKKIAKKYGEHPHCDKLLHRSFFSCLHRNFCSLHLSLLHFFLKFSSKRTTTTASFFISPWMSVFSHGFSASKNIRNITKLLLNTIVDYFCGFYFFFGFLSYFHSQSIKLNVDKKWPTKFS